jgi:predicted TIM-barrel fold metal-dependent hydrolase
MPEGEPSHLEMIAWARDRVSLIDRGFPLRLGRERDLETMQAVLAHLERTQPTDTQADLTERARVLIEDAVTAAKPLIVQNDMVLHWRVERQLRTRIAAALQSEREAAAAEARRAAYDDAKQAALNPFLCEEEDGPLDLQRKIGQAIEYRKKLALASPPAPQEET